MRFTISDLEAIEDSSVAFFVSFHKLIALRRFRANIDKILSLEFTIFAGAVGQKSYHLIHVLVQR